MHHTLLPIHERKALRREYRLRLIAVFLLLLSFALLIGMGALFPSYVKILYEEKAELGTALSLQNNKDLMEISAKEKELADDKFLVDELAKTNTSIRPSSLIESIGLQRGSVSLTSIDVDLTSTTTAVMIIQGVAPTRDELLKFKEKLENLVPGNIVDLPLSQLAKNTKLQFSLKLTQKMQ